MASREKTGLGSKWKGKGDGVVVLTWNPRIWEAEASGSCVRGLVWDT